MISVQNHLRQLNGNSLFLWILLSTLLFVSACDSLKSAQTTTEKPKEEKEELDEIKGKRVWNPETGKFEYKVPEGKVDTVAWTETPVEEVPPITSDGSTSGVGKSVPPGTKLASYNVAVILPFLTNQFREFDDEINSKSKLALDFYSGTKLAFDDLSNRGIGLNISVFDSQASEFKTESVLQKSELANAHMIIGPVKKSNLVKTANYAKDNEKVLVSPLSPSTGVTTDNPYYVQVNPSLQSHCEAITEHALANYPAGQIVLVCRNKSAERNRLRYFQNANYAVQGSNSAPSLKEFIVTDQSADYNEMDVAPYILPGKTTVFIVPSWSNESFIYTLLRKISIAKGREKVVVYGMPQWMKYERISYDYYESLTVRVSNASYIDKDNYDIDSFKRRYFDLYGNVPAEEAYKGYDIMMYFGEMIEKYGTGFQEYLDREASQRLHTVFNFEPNVPLDARGEDYSRINFYENKSVNILEFKDYHFRKID